MDLHGCRNPFRKRVHATLKEGTHMRTDTRTRMRKYTCCETCPKLCPRGACMRRTPHLKHNPRSKQANKTIPNKPHRARMPLLCCRSALNVSLPLYHCACCERKGMAATVPRRPRRPNAETCTVAGIHPPSPSACAAQAAKVTLLLSQTLTLYPFFPIASRHRARRQSQHDLL